MKTIELVCLGRLKKRKTNLVGKKNAWQKKISFSFMFYPKLRCFCFKFLIVPLCVKSLLQIVAKICLKDMGGSKKIKGKGVV